MKIRQYSCKESLKISVVAKFESDLWKTNLDIALQSREILFVWWGAVNSVLHGTNICKMSWLCGAISFLSSDLQPLKLVSHFILRPSFRQCQWIFT